MPTVELKQLRGEAGQAAQYLRSKLKGKIRVKGSQIHIEDAKSRHVKLLLNKFIHHSGLEGYRVVASGFGNLEVHEFRRSPDRPAAEGSPPMPSVTMPYMFPSYGKGSIFVPGGKRSKRRP